MNGHAYGKVILLGEHAVVYGVPALAVGIDRGAIARAEPLARGPSRLHIRGTRPVLADEPDSDLARAFRDVLAACGRAQPAHVEVSTDLPAGAGLGCSAALGVAIVRALESLAGEAGGPIDQTIARAMAWERVFHGNPSGVDATVAATGGCRWFVRGGANEGLRLGASLSLAIGHTGLPSSTKGMVEGVARLRQRRPEAVAKAFEGIEALVTNARGALEAGDVRALGKLFDLNQMILSGLFVSSAEIEQLCGVARRAGALGAKLTGAGGGGCVAALCEGQAEVDAVLSAWKAEGYDGFASVVRADSPAPRLEAPAPP
jgi:mevalonate kinase